MTSTALQHQLLICGLGGQGILFLSRVIAVAAMLDGDQVITAETHGMAQRGGAVEAHLKLGDFASSLVRPGSADAVLVLDPTRLEAALRQLAPGGRCFANAPSAVEGAHCLDAAAEGRAMGHVRGQNIVLLGYAAALAPELWPSSGALRSSLERHSTADWRAENGRAFDRGVALAGRA